MNSKISVIIATKNASRSLRQCLDSLVCQTYTGYEILIQDAASTDGTAKIVQSYSCKQLKLNVEQDNGIYDAWNRALRHATGDWIMFLGADDRLAHRRVLENRLELLNQCSKPVDLVCGRMALVDESGAILRIIGSAWDWTRMLKYQNVIHIGLMHHKRLFDKFGGFNSKYKIAGDYEFLLRLGWQTKALFVDEVEILAGASGRSQVNVSTVLYETFVIQSQQREIGPARASINFGSAWMKAIYRKA